LSNCGHTNRQAIFFITQNQFLRAVNQWYIGMVKETYKHNVDLVVKFIHTSGLACSSNKYNVNNLIFK